MAFGNLGGHFPRARGPPSTPDRIRTCNPRFRSPMRYPIAPSLGLTLQNDCKTADYLMSSAILQPFHELVLDLAQRIEADQTSDHESERAVCEISQNKQPLKQRKHLP